MDVLPTLAWGEPLMATTTSAPADLLAEIGAWRQMSSQMFRPMRMPFSLKTEADLPAVK